MKQGKKLGRNLKQRNKKPKKSLKKNNTIVFSKTIVFILSLKRENSEVQYVLFWAM
jgi:hypothetical protein